MRTQKRQINYCFQIPHNLVNLTIFVTAHIKLVVYSAKHL